MMKHRKEMLTYTHRLGRFRKNSAKKLHNKDQSADNKEIGNSKVKAKLLPHSS